MSKSKDYKQQLRDLQIHLVRYQQWSEGSGAKALVIFEGRDSAGKDGAIARITEHLTARRTRAVALPKPTDRDRTEWYFQRYVRYLPAAGELVIFNRSWYNRAGVEPVMGFCTDEEHKDFLRDAPTFEHMLQEAGTKIVKLWLDISKKEQAERLDARRKDPLKLLKVSALDGEAQKRWGDYSRARNEMLARTSTEASPWWCVHTDRKKQARLNIIRHLLHQLAPEDIHASVPRPDRDVLYHFEMDALTDGRLEK
ncbi:MAG TPA: polyphosphate kinase 2 [Caulobacteraceae bacterium]|jgi:polyphosphate kinase 2|nr:polyphosphate kinase 2 [Caulobacteraceae bacterium]